MNCVQVFLEVQEVLEVLERHVRSLSQDRGGDRVLHVEDSQVSRGYISSRCNNEGQGEKICCGVKCKVVRTKFLWGTYI